MKYKKVEKLQTCHTHLAFEEAAWCDTFIRPYMDFYQAMWIWKAAVRPGESFIIEKEIPLSLAHCPMLHCPMQKQYRHRTTHVHTSQQSSVMITHYWRTEAPPRLRLKQLGGKSLKLPKEIYPKGFTHSLTHCLVWVCVRIRWGKNRGIRPMQI